MANVIQTKKKRDKKKKREDSTEDFPIHQPAPTIADDLNIHVHKEATTGGGLCAKLIFFVLLTVISTLIGLIITEHRGLTDLDTIDTKSAFSHIFEGWIDKTPEEHQETYSAEHSHEEEDSEGAHSEEVSDEQEPNTNESEHEDDEEEYQQTVEDETEETKIHEYLHEESEVADESVAKDETNEEESRASVLSQGEAEDEDEGFRGEIIKRLSEKSRDTSQDQEQNISEEEEEAEMFKVDDVEKQEVEKDHEQEPENYVPDDETEKIEQEASNMVVRFGVGAALLVVAHVVLIRKWRTARVSTPEGKAELSGTDLARRNTIVPPPTLDEIGQDFEHIEEDYSEDEEDENEDDDVKHHASHISPVEKAKYQELISTYSHNLSPDWEPKRVVTSYDDDEEEESYEEDEEEDDETEERDQDENDIISENEDEELLRRLEAKYGIFRQPLHQREEEDEMLEEEQEEEEEEEEEEEVEEDDDGDEEGFDEDGSRPFHHWKHEKIKSGVVDSDSEDDRWSNKHSGANSVYDFSNITNADDWKIREELDKAEQNLPNDAAFALTLFNKILDKHPFSPRASYGKARSLDFIAEKKRSNKLLEEAIVAYQQIFKMTDVPDALFQLAGQRCINRMRFRGAYTQAIPVHKLLINRFPKNVNAHNELAVTYLTMNNFYEAKKVLYDILSKWPDNGFAMVNYGFILKLYDLDLKQAAKFLKKGIETKQPGVIDGRFFYHLGDALIRLGRKDEAMAVHIEGVNNKVFLSKYQRSLHNVNRLLGKPWWEKDDMPNLQFFEKIEQNWKIIRDEGLRLLDTDGLFKMETEDLREVGDWKQFELYGRGMKNVKNCKECPKTCKLMESFPDAIGCKRGQIKFSVVQPGTHVWPHCGPTNCRLRSHLGLKVPSDCFLRVGDEIRSWQEGKLLIFDDSFEHEIWHNGSSTRLVLIIDFWHPELTKEEKRILSSV